MLDKIVKDLGDKIINSLENSNLDNIYTELSNIKSPALLCGIGGSHVVSIFLEKVLVIKNNIIAKNIDVEEYFLTNFSNYNNLVLLSHSGNNHGIKSLLATNKNKYLFTTRKSKVTNEITLNYSIENRIKSFVSFEDTIIPLSIILGYYLNFSHFPVEIFSQEETFDILDFNNVNIIYDETSKTCAIFLETSMIEAGISSVTMHTKYSFCHGRSNLVSNKESLVIYLMTRESELDKMLTTEIKKISNNVLILKELTKDSVIADYLLTIKALRFLNYLNKTYHKEFVNVKYNKIVSTTYHFKGDLV
ncbi:MAG: hypothetical protein HFJ02_04400 [Bacilli bacterium]|nr:hypothetical protein [Bacilli bacterium]